jgi:hypothetical protein
MTTRQRLLDMITEPKLFEWDPDEIEAMQLEAARDLVNERISQIAVLRKRAEETGIAEVRSFHDLVPLLFAHTTYKSYPASFIERGQWDRMLKWFQTLSAVDVSNVDLEGVANVDEWVQRLWDAGHKALTTSGSSGKVSFLNQTQSDRDGKARHFRATMGWPLARPNADRPFFSVSPHVGFNSNVEAVNIQAGLWGRPGDIYFLTDEPLRISDVSAGAALRKRMSEGTATPEEIEAHERANRGKAQHMREAMQGLAEKILSLRHEPIFLGALWAQHMMVIERARAMGIPDGDFHPQSIIAAGGGVKGVALPPDYKEQVTRFYGDVIRPGGYGMTEMAHRWPACEHKRYHRPPGLVLLPLDRAGERLLTKDDAVGGVVEGRMAFLDLMFDGRWGGLISGDKVQVDFRPCPCGRPGPTILDTITRYAQQPGEDDHIGCAGTIDSYVRGEIAA